MQNQAQSPYQLKAGKTTCAGKEDQLPRILCVDDHSMVIEGITRILESTNRGRVVARSAKAEDVLPLLETVGVDVCLLDLLLCSRQSLWLIEPLKKREPPVRVVVFTMVRQKILLQKAIALGADAIVHKADGGEDLLDAIASVLQGESFLSQTVKSLLQESDSRDARADPLGSLTAREIEVFELIGVGKGNKEIAELLSLSVKTVETHRENLKRKLGLASSRDLIREAYYLTTG